VTWSLRTPDMLRTPLDLRGFRGDATAPVRMKNAAPLI
jgi:hypothetical protein